MPGGKREGSGRKAQGNDRTSKVAVNPPELKLLDEHRGEESRSSVVRRLIRKEFEPQST